MERVERECEEVKWKKGERQEEHLKKKGKDKHLKKEYEGKIRRGSTIEVKAE